MSKVASDYKWDVFLSHASEDKDNFARPLAQALEKRGVRVWFDEAEIRLGDSLTEKINEGLANSYRGVVLLSKVFLTKYWTKRETGAFVAIEAETGEKRILPVWLDVTRSDLTEKAAVLADVAAAEAAKKSIDEIAEDIILALDRAGDGAAFANIVAEEKSEVRSPGSGATEQAILNELLSVVPRSAIQAIDQGTYANPWKDSVTAPIAVLTEEFNEVEFAFGVHALEQARQDFLDAAWEFRRLEAFNGWAHPHDPERRYVGISAPEAEFDQDRGELFENRVTLLDDAATRLKERYDTLITVAKQSGLDVSALNGPLHRRVREHLLTVYGEPS